MPLVGAVKLDENFAASGQDLWVQLPAESDTPLAKGLKRDLQQWLRVCITLLRNWRV